MSKEKLKELILLEKKDQPFVKMDQKGKVVSSLDADEIEKIARRVVELLLERTKGD